MHHITGEVARGDLLALVGPNGAGKSTLLKGIIGQLKPLAGSLSLDGLKRSDIAYLPQQIDIDRSFPITVFDAVAMGLWRDIGAWRGLDRERSLAVLEALHTLGLQDLGERSVGALSGGQFQRVLFARLLLQDAAIILLDEPFRAVDTKTVEDLLRLIGRWHSRRAHRHCRAARSRSGTRAFPENAADRPRGRGLGTDQAGADRRRTSPSRASSPRRGTSMPKFASAARQPSRADVGMIHALIDPFVEFAFMRRALVGCFALSLGAPPVGVFLVLRRLSLMGDAMSHAILPGAAIGFLVAGLSVPAMSLGGFIAGIAVVLLAGFVTRSTILREDASLAAFYLVSLALGVLIVSVKGSSIDLLHVLFGTVLALDDTALILIAAIATLHHADARHHLPAARARMLRSKLLGLGQSIELTHPLSLPRARGD